LRHSCMGNSPAVNILYLPAYALHGLVMEKEDQVNHDSGR